MSSFTARIFTVYLSGLLLLSPLLVYAASPCSDRFVDFNNRASDTYWRSWFETDFQNVVGYSDSERSRHWINSNHQLKIKLLANALTSVGGVVADVDLVSSPEYTLKYRIKFAQDFDWSKGGKILGLAGGEGYTACTGDATRANGDGWSFRLNWAYDSEWNGGRPFLHPYVYYQGMQGSCGNNFGAKFTIEDAVWYNIELYVKMNTEANSNGVIRMRINDTIVYENTNFKWVTSDIGRKVDTLRWDVFRGGSGEEYMSNADWEIFFDDFSIDNAFDMDLDTWYFEDPMITQNGYIFVPDGTGTDPRGYANQSVEILKDGYYEFRLLANAPDSNGDSIYLWVDNYLQVVPSFNRNYWQIETHDEWTWDTFEYPIFLSAGIHDISLTQREDGLKTAKLIITEYLQ